MKLSQIHERVVSKRTLKDDAKKDAMSAKAADLKPYLDKVATEKDVAGKMSAAKELASHFEVGGKEKFLNALEKCKTASQIDFLCYNAALKGEGNGVSK